MGYEISRWVYAVLECTLYWSVHCIGVYTAYLVGVSPVRLVPGGHSGIDVVVHCIGDCYQEVSKNDKNNFGLPYFHVIKHF